MNDRFLTHKHTSMKILPNPRTPFRHLVILGIIALLPFHVRADSALSNPLLFKGYQAVTNVLFLAPASPGFAQVRFAGEGGFAHLGRMKSSSVDQSVNLATGEQTGHTTYEDLNGDQLVMSFVSPTTIRPDGLITFAGEMTVVSGTGR